MTTTPSLWKSQTQVNTSDGGVFQGDGQITSLQDGGYVVVWEDASLTYNPLGDAIVGQRYDSAGNKVGGEVKLSQFVAGEQITPAVTALSNGNMAVAFIDHSSGDYDTYVRIFDSALNLVRTDIIDLGGANHTADPSLTALAGGSYVISYTLSTTATTDIVARIVNPTGEVGGLLGIDGQIANQNFSELATLSNGNFVVVDQSEFFGDPTDTNIFFSIFTPAGTRVAGPVTFSGGFSFGLETDPDVAALRDGGFVVVWTDPDSDVGDIRAAIFSNAGGLATDNILVNTTTAGVQDEASVAGLADGGFLVTWEDDTANLVHAQRFDAAGSKIGAEFTVKNGVSPVDSPEAALLADGRIAYALGDVSTGDPDVMTSIFTTVAAGINHAPVVTVPNPTVQAAAGQTLQASALFSATDSDSDPLTYLLYDNTAGSGHFAINGVTQAANQIISVSAAQLAQTTFVPTPGASDDLLVGASDGSAFSGWSNLHVDGPVNHVPVVTVPNPTVDATPGQTLQLSGLLSATDADNDPLSFVFYDGTAGGGHFAINGVTQAANEIFSVSAAQLAQTTFVAGPSGVDDLLVGASDGHAFSGWSELHIV
jgi:hypothetical protein